jgi:hypothetical protein
MDQPKTKAKDTGNLYQEYDPEFMAQYAGCQHLECMRECNLATGFCARLQMDWERWELSFHTCIECSHPPDCLHNETCQRKAD